MSHNDTDWYGLVGSILGGLVGIIAFIGVMIAACKEAGWVIGIALGWIPAGIVAVIAGGLVRFLWLPALAMGYLFYNFEVKEQKRTEQAEIRQREQEERREDTSRRVQQKAHEAYERKTAVKKMVHDFTKDPRHSHYERLRFEMAKYVENKTATTLEEAYALACASDAQCSAEKKARQ